jgi:secreted trypsin-like serine protease
MGSRNSVRQLARVLVCVGVAASVLVGCGDDDSDDSSGKAETQGATKFVAADFSETQGDVVGDVPSGVTFTPSTAANLQAADDSLPSDDIIGGEPIDADLAPWTAAIVLAGQPDASLGQFCGGSLVTPQVVMTAAHCVVVERDAQGNTTYVRPDAINVVLGREDLASSEGERIALSGLAWHPDYDPGAYGNDWAVLFLEEPSSLEPINLPPTDAPGLWQPGGSAIVAGWGCNRAGVAKGDPACSGNRPELSGALVDLQDQASCASPPLGQLYDPSNMLCARDLDATQAACFGDSGGPLAVYGSDDKWYVIGVVSWGAVPCQMTTNNYYAFVPASYPWLAQLGDS